MVKAHQGAPHQAIAGVFAGVQASRFSGLAPNQYATVEDTYGRRERRTYWMLMDPAVLRQIDPKGR